mgnify:CR=1 FL=1
MPELPEVEVTRRALAPFAEGRRVRSVVVRERRLRWLVPARLRGEIKDGVSDNQDRIPLAKQREAEGHAVRANYLYAGAADLFCRARFCLACRSWLC